MSDMKKLVLMIIPALICGIWVVSSCNKENNMSSALNIKAVVISSPSVKNTLTEEEMKVDTLLWCQGKNIEWYNETTGEIKFKKLENEDRFLVTASGFMVYLGEELLFQLGGSMSVMSYTLNYPVLVDGVDESFNDDYRQGKPDWYASGNEIYPQRPLKYYIGRGYPNWEYWTEEFWTRTNWDKTVNADWVEEREKNWKAIEPGLNKFIEQLKKEGKHRK